MQVQEANQLHGDDASGQPAVAPVVHDDREAAEPGPTEASDAEPASSSWDQAASDAPAASPAQTPPAAPKDPRFGGSINAPTPGRSVNKPAQEQPDQVGSIFVVLLCLAIYTPLFDQKVSST